MIGKVEINIRDNQMYPYSISYMGREEVLMTQDELIELYWQINSIILNNEELWEI